MAPKETLLITIIFETFNRWSIHVDNLAFQKIVINICMIRLADSNCNIWTFTYYVSLSLYVFWYKHAGNNNFFFQFRIPAATKCHKHVFVLLSCNSFLYFWKYIICNSLIKMRMQQILTCFCLVVSTCIRHPSTNIVFLRRKLKCSIKCGIK